MLSRQHFQKRDESGDSHTPGAFIFRMMLPRSLVDLVRWLVDFVRKLLSKIWISVVVAAMKVFSENTGILSSLMCRLTPQYMASKGLVVSSGVIDAALGALKAHHSNVPLVENALALLCASVLPLNGLHCEHFHRCVATFEEAGGIPLVVSTMRSHPRKKRIQLVAMNILLSLVGSGDVNYSFVRHGCVPLVMNTMVRLRKHADIQWVGCFTVAVLLLHGSDITKGAVEQAGGIPILVDLIKSHCDACGDAKIFIHSTLAIGLLAESCNRVKTAVARNSGTRAILRGMYRHVNNDELQITAMRAIGRLIYGRYDIMRTFGATGGIQVLMAILEEHAGNSRVVSLAVELLTVVPNIMTEPCVAKCNISTVISVMDHQPNQEHIQDFALSLLALWVTNNDDSGCILGMIRSNPNVTRTIVAAMVIHAENESIQQRACALLGRLSSIADLSRPLLRSGGLIVLVDAMKLFSNNLTIQEFSCLVFVNLAYINGLEEPIRRSGFIPAAFHAICRYSNNIKLRLLTGSVLVFVKHGER